MFTISFSILFLISSCKALKSCSRPMVSGSHNIIATRTRHHHSLLWSKPNDDDNNEEASLSLDSFQQRKQAYTTNMRKGMLQRPPNPFLTPTEFVQGVLQELKHPHTSQSGYMCLLESSTPEWRKILFGSVGASHETATNKEVAASLQGLFQKKNNQFGILVGVEDKDYVLDMPCHIDFMDGTSWVECRFRNPRDEELLVVTGWSLKQRALDGAWQLDKLEWQDFRDKYRPGIGREEWERICG